MHYGKKFLRQTITKEQVAHTSPFRTETKKVKGDMPLKN